LPLKEGMDTRPKSPYGISKRTAEQYCNLFGELHPDFKVAVLRLFNVCGAGGEGVIWKFIRQINDGESLKVYGSGEQTRDFIDVRDVVSVIESMLENNASGIYNVGRGVETSVNALVEMLKSAGKTFSVEHVEEKEGDIERSVADISKIKEDLGWGPKYGIDESISELMK